MEIALRPMRVLLAVAPLVALGQSASSASEITFLFGGTISEVVPGASQEIPGGLPAIGSSFTVQYKFDSAAPDDRVESSIGEYQAVSELRLLLGSSGVELLLLPGEIPDGRGQIQVYPGYDGGHLYNTTVSLSASSGSVSPGFDDSFRWLAVGVDLLDEDFAALPSDALPHDLAISSFERRHLILAAQFSEDYLGFLGQIDSFVVVPEPTPCALIALGLAILRCNRVRGQPSSRGRATGR
jgi:hypothetical protein